MSTLCEKSLKIYIWFFQFLHLGLPVFRLSTLNFEKIIYFDIYNQEIFHINFFLGTPQYTRKTIKIYCIYMQN